MNRPKKILIVVTSHDQINAKHLTGLCLEEFAVPYAEFKRARYEIAVASPRGGVTPIAPTSQPTPEQQRSWAEAIRLLLYARRLEAMRPIDYDAIFIPGGYGAMFDLPGNPALQRLIAELADKDKVVGAIGHGSAAFVNVKLAHGRSFVEGKTLTGFTDTEEEKSKFATLVPFTLESRLREEGATFVSAPSGTEHQQTDGYLVTGQNSQSSSATARAIVQLLNHSPQRPAPRIPEVAQAA